jgi:hypothetical protein
MNDINKETQKLTELRKSIKKEIDKARMPLAYHFLVTAQTTKIYHNISESEFHGSNSYDVGIFYKPLTLINFIKDER